MANFWGTVFVGDLFEVFMGPTTTQEDDEDDDDGGASWTNPLGALAWLAGW